MIRSRFLPVLAGCLCLASASFAQPSTTPGTLPGDIVVDSSGAASYSIPISLPSGTGGMEPDLALNYSSMGGNGLLGVGWSLSGLSAISRAPRTLPEDNYIAGINFDDANFALDGQRLVEIEPDPPVSGGSGEYRTRLESFSRVKRHGGSAHNPDHWTVETKAGLTMTFGSTENPDANSRVMREGDSHVITWLLDRIEDTLGNYITFEYHEADFGGTRSHLIKQINYTGNAKQGVNLDPYYSVQFLYGERNDTSSGYLLGTPFSTTHRLTDILVIHGTDEITNPAHASVVRRYNLDYGEPTGPHGGYSAANGLSLLRGIHLTGSDGTESLALPKTEFSYTEPLATAPSYPTLVTSNLGAWHEPDSTVPPHFESVTFSVDGRAEMVKVFPVKIGSNWHTRLKRYSVEPGSSGGHTWQQSFSGSLLLTGSDASLPTISQEYRPEVFFADVTGNGRPEIILTFEADSDGLKRFIRVFSYNAELGHQLNSLQLIYQDTLDLDVIPFSWYARRDVFVADTNGDGLPWIHLLCVSNSGTVWIPAYQPLPETFNGSSMSFVKPLDRPALLYFHDGLGGPDPEPDFEVGLPELHDPDDLSYFFTDFNGDGLPDFGLLYREKASGKAVILVFEGYHDSDNSNYPRFRKDAGSINMLGDAGVWDK